MMMDWLGERHGIAALTEAALLIEEAVDESFATRALRPMEFGGDQGLQAATNAVIHTLHEAQRELGVWKQFQANLLVRPPIGRRSSHVPKLMPGREW